MSKTSPNILETVDRVAREIAAPNAETVDREATFPRASIDALAKAGLMGLVSSSDIGGMGQGPGAAAKVVERLARECGSTAMVVTMHYSGAAVLEKHGSDEVRREIAAGRHLSTLAFSEAGSRSHFWAPVSTAKPAGNGKRGVELHAQKSWVTSASQATAYVWSSRPVSAEGASTLWFVPRESNVEISRSFDGIGLRGNDSRPIAANGVFVPESNRLGNDGDGFSIMMGVVLPLFNLMSAGVSVGLMEAATTRTAEHAGGTRYAHLDSALAELPTVRAYVARMRVKTDSARALLDDAIVAVESGRDDAMLRVLECKAGAAESALEVASLGMRVCGGAAYRKEVGVERIFRDAQAANIMAPTTDQLYDFIGKAVCGLPLF